MPIEITDEMISAANLAHMLATGHDRASRSAMRAALEAALAAAPVAGADAPEPAGDAEFERLLDELSSWVSTRDYWANVAAARAAREVFAGNDAAIRYDGTVQYWCELVADRRDHILDLHRRERMRGRREALEELRETIFQESETCDRKSVFQDHIDAMLEGGAK